MQSGCIHFIVLVAVNKDSSSTILLHHLIYLDFLYLTIPVVSHRGFNLHFLNKYTQWYWVYLYVIIGQLHTFGKMFKSCHFKNWFIGDFDLFYYFLNLLSCRSLLFILYIRPLSDICFANMIFQSVVCLFLCLTKSFEEQHFNLVKSNKAPCFLICYMFFVANSR